MKNTFVKIFLVLFITIIILIAWFYRCSSIYEKIDKEISLEDIEQVSVSIFFSPENIGEFIIDDEEKIDELLKILNSIKIRKTFKGKWHFGAMGKKDPFYISIYSKKGKEKLHLDFGGSTSIGIGDWRYKIINHNDVHKIYEFVIEDI